VPDPCPPPPTVRNTKITGNAADYGGGVAARDGLAIDLEGCTVAGNNAGTGGAFYVGLDTGFEPTYIRADATIAWGNCAVTTESLVAFGDANGALYLNCSVYDDSDIGSPAQVSADSSSTADPLFCGPEDCYYAPTVAGDYTLTFGSPALPAGNVCGVLIGACDEGCSITGLPGDVTAGQHLAAYPNPFSGKVSLRLGADIVSVRVFDLAGRFVRDLTRDRGAIDLVWDGRDASGAAAPPGVYFLRASGPEGSATLRVVKLP